MTTHERLVLHGLTQALADRFSKQGHPMQLVTNEFRGYCTPRACAPSCVGLRKLLDDAVELLEQEAAAMEQERPVQGELIGEVAG